MGAESISTTDALGRDDTRRDVVRETIVGAFWGRRGTSLPPEKLIRIDGL